MEMFGQLYTRLFLREGSMKAGQICGQVYKLLSSDMQDYLEPFLRDWSSDDFESEAVARDVIACRLCNKLRPGQQAQLTDVLEYLKHGDTLR